MCRSFRPANVITQNYAKLRKQHQLLCHDARFFYDVGVELHFSLICGANSATHGLVEQSFFMHVNSSRTVWSLGKPLKSSGPTFNKELSTNVISSNFGLRLNVSDSKNSSLLYSNFNCLSLGNGWMSTFESLTSPVSSNRMAIRSPNCFSMFFGKYLTVWLMIARPWTALVSCWTPLNIPTSMSASIIDKFSVAHW